MTLLVDLFGYLVIILHGLVIAAQSIALGSVVFLVCLARPRAWLLGDRGKLVLADTIRIGAWAALALALAEAARVGLDGAVLTGTADLSLADVLTANFAEAGLVKIAAALLLALLLRLRAGAVPLLGLAFVILAAGTATTHAAARLDDRPLLLAVSALHQAGAAIWIGGIPAFIAALARVTEPEAATVVGRGFSRISIASVVCILTSAGVLAWYYIGDVKGFYGTAYGVMVGAKIALFGLLLALGWGNNRAIARLDQRRPPAGRRPPLTRLRRFAEAEIGIGITLFFAASSLTSVPPAVDLGTDRASWQEIVDRNTPVWPRLASPDHDSLAIPALQAKLDAEAAASASKPQPAFVPGAGEIASRNAEDIAWSEYNHHWAGIFVIVIGICALLDRAGVRAARHWPLLFLVMAAFLFVRSDPEVWPIGPNGFFASLRDVEVLQHKFFVLLIVVFGIFEWRVRAFGWNARGAAYVFPLVTAVGAAALLTHSHAIANVKDQLLIEITHTPLALAGVTAGWARWLELRLDPPESRIAGWVWPLCFVLVGIVLLIYREA
jgi:putative copper resistance protein D